MSELIIIFFTGFFCYPILEILWRGYTHPTMAFAGGLCFLAIYYINFLFYEKSVFLKAFLSASIITAVEFIFGYFFNIIKRMNIWDYSAMPYNIMGQICPQYFMLWFFLSLLLSPLCNFLKLHIFIKQ